MFEVERLETDALTVVELALELDPMETQSVQESRHALHSDKNDGGEDGPWSEKYENGGATDPRIHLQTVPEHHRPEHFRQFCTQRAKRWNRSGYCHFWG